MLFVLCSSAQDLIYLKGIFCDPKIQNTRLKPAVILKLIDRSLNKHMKNNSQQLSH